MTHLVELGLATFILWGFVIQVSQGRMPTSGLAAYIRPLIVLAIVLGMEITPPRALEIIAAVGMASLLYCLVDI